MDSSTFLSLHNFMKTFVSLFLKNFITAKVVIGKFSSG